MKKKRMLCLGFITCISLNGFPVNGVYCAHSKPHDLKFSCDVKCQSHHGVKGSTCIDISKKVKK